MLILVTKFLNGVHSNQLITELSALWLMGELERTISAATTRGCMLNLVWHQAVNVIREGPLDVAV